MSEHQSFPFDLDHNLALGAEHEVALQARLRAPEADREVPLPIAAVREQFHQHEVLESSAKVRPGGGFQPAAGHVPREPHIEQIELRYPGQDRT